MKILFTKDDDGSDEAYYGVLLVPDRGSNRLSELRTPYFRYKIDCEAYTRELAEVNDLDYDYYINVWFHRGQWDKPNNI